MWPGDQKHELKMSGQHGIANKRKRETSTEDETSESAAGTSESFEEPPSKRQPMSYRYFSIENKSKLDLLDQEMPVSSTTTTYIEESNIEVTFDFIYQTLFIFL